MKLPLILMLGAGLVALSACEKQVEAPMDAGVCWHVVFPKDQPPKFNRLVANQPNLETCAASLEAMRVKFLRMGGGNDSIVGAYQGKFIFLQREGIFTGNTLTGGRYLALVRTGDGRLAIPGAMPSQ